MMSSARILTCIGALVAALAGPARAQDDDAAGPEAASSPTALDWYFHPGARRAEARVVAEIELRHGHAFAPVTLAPDVAIGLDDRVAVLIHTSRAAEMGVGAGNGVCVLPPNETLGPTRETCPSLEPGFGASVLVRFDRLGTVARLGVMTHDWRPLALAGLAGVATTVRAGRWYAQVAPTLVIGLDARDDGNRDRVQVPLFAGVAPTPRTEVHLRSGLDATLATFHDTYAIPLGAGASVRLRRVRFGADFSFDKALGPLNALGWRSASLYLQTPIGSW
jgi:hypothetical protein